MFKATFLEGTISLTITPDGPILVKAGDTGGADPTRPDMEFVRTRAHGREQIYLPGSSLKGVVRAQCERICRSLDSEDRQQQHLQELRALDKQNEVPLLQHSIPLADNPLGDGKKYKNLADTEYSTSKYMDSISEEFKGQQHRTAIVYRRSAFTTQMFGHTSLAGRIRFADAYSPEPETLQTEMRNGVAIDRVYGAVAVGPFNYETLVDGSFTTKITFRNTTLAHLALLGLALRDLAAGRVGVGFGKSRGLGRVKVTFDRFDLRYPVCELNDGRLKLLNGRDIAAATELAGVGAFAQSDTQKHFAAYHFPAQDTAELPNGLSYTKDKEEGMPGVELNATGDEEVRSIWRACMPCWKQELGLE
jgi:CRISPR/Cas system CSM-associated protein Csm3 (group 7 of RAMP superfamily)